jgi:hypothetical protein
MSSTVKVDVPAFWDHGYQIVRGVYSPDEIQQLRENAYASRGVGGDLLSKPLMRDVLLDGTLVGIARQLLGSDEIVYGGDSSYTINSNQHGYHKDNADRKDPSAPDWQSRYTILRFGIYLQDHSAHTGGLNLRDRSHNSVSLRKGRNVYVRSSVGDVVVWSLRTSHSGNGSLLTFPRWFHPAPYLAELPRRLRRRNNRYPHWWPEATADGDRIAVFAALGLDDAHHRRYTNYLKTRTYMCDIWRRSLYDEEVFTAARKIGLTVWDMRREVEGDPTVGKNAAWQPIPY